MSYIRIWLHCVWGTKSKIPYLNDTNLNDILIHIKENAKTKKIYIDSINGDKDHIHCIISLDANQTIMKVMQLIKGESSNWINKSKLVKGKFEWADEYFAVSVSESILPHVREYIKKQKEHHSSKTWLEEQEEFMTKFRFVKVKG